LQIMWADDCSLPRPLLGWSGCGALAEVHRDAASVVVEHRNEFEARAERLQVLAQRCNTRTSSECSSLEIAP
jgi:hypothetical protein